MKASKRISNRFAMFALFFVTLALIVTELAVWSQPVLIKTPEDAANRLKMLLESVGKNDYATVSQCLAGNPDLGMDRQPDSAVGQLLWQRYTESFTYRLEGSIHTTEAGLAQNVAVEYLDIQGIMSGLNQRTNELLKKRVAEAERPADVYDEEFNLREDVVMDVLLEAVEEALRENPQTVREVVTVSLVQQDGQWWVLADSALLGMISGNTL